MQNLSFTPNDRAHILARIRKHATFARALQRRYRTPKGFTHAQDWIEEAVIAAYLIKTNPGAIFGLDYSNHQFAALGQMYVQARTLPPHYWIGRDLVQALWQSLIKAEDIQPLEHLFAQQFVLHFPQDALFSPHDGAVKAIHCLYCRQGDKLIQGDRTAASPDERLAYTATTTTGVLFAGILRIGDPTERPWDIDDDLLRSHHTVNDPVTEQEFVHRIESFLFQIFLVAQARPDLIGFGRDESLFAAMSRSKQKKRLDQSNLPFTPNWIGKSYSLPRQHSQALNGCHASPRMHIRRGHWRQQPYGPKTNPMYRMKWIQPMVVGHDSR